MNMLWSVLRVAASAALLYHALGLTPAAWLMWLAPLPLMLYRDQSMGWRRALAEPLTAYLAGGMAWWPYLSGMAPAPVAMLAIAQPALVFAAGMALAWLARRRQRALLATLMLPLTVAGCELLVTTLSPHGSFGSIAYTQSDNLALMQLLSVTGLTGVTALLCWVPAGLSALCFEPWRPKQALLLAAAPLLVLALVLWAGRQRLDQAQQGARMDVALLADDTSLRDYNKPDQLDAVFAGYAAQVRLLGRARAELVLLPEKALSVAPARLPWLKEQLQMLASETDMTLVVGLNVVGAPKQNLAWVAQPGQALHSYQKQHLVPGWEHGYAPGTAPLLVKRGERVIGLAICKDLDFPRTMGAYGGAALLVVPAWDFGADAWLHSRMAMARSIEQGIPMLRSAHEGRMTLSSAHGVVLYEIGSNDRGPVLVKTAMATGAVPTIYASVGDLAGWLLVAAWLAAIVALVRPSILAGSKIRT